MSVLKIVKEYGESVGVIPRFDTDASLASLRNEIREDFEVERFFFKVHGKKLETSHEETITVEDAAAEVQESSGNHRVVQLITSSTTAKRAANIGSDGASSEVPRPPRQSEKQEPPRTPKSSKSMFLRSPMPWEVRGVKIYSREEILASRGMEIERRQFWNGLAKKLCRETEKSKDAISKEIEVAWRKHQAKLLLEEEKVLAEYGVKGRPGNKPGTLGKNAERIRSNQEELERIDALIEAAKQAQTGAKRKLELEQLEARKRFHLSDMRKAQDTMRKNLKMKVSDLKGFTKKQ